MAFLRYSTRLERLLVTILQRAESIETDTTSTSIEIYRVSSLIFERNPPSRGDLLQEGDLVLGLNIMPCDTAAIVRRLEDSKRRQLWSF